MKNIVLSLDISQTFLECLKNETATFHIDLICYI